MPPRGDADKVGDESPSKMDAPGQVYDLNGGPANPLQEVVDDGVESVGVRATENNAGAPIHVS